MDDFGKGFIHVHHLRPLHTIRKNYVVNYKNDLIPVCPNCHAMIHRIPNGENMTVDEIKEILGSTNRIKRTSVTFETKLSNSITKTKTIKQQSEKCDNINTSSKTNFSVLPNIKKGCTVIHKSFGKGSIVNINISKKHIDILFTGGEKTFAFDAFDKGF